MRSPLRLSSSFALSTLDPRHLKSALSITTAARVGAPTRRGSIVERAGCRQGRHRREPAAPGNFSRQSVGFGVFDCQIDSAPAIVSLKSRVRAMACSPTFSVCNPASGQ